MTDDHRIYDTYFALLEQPELRRFDRCGHAMEYKTAKFDQEIYSRAAGMTFLDEHQAYAHWIGSGRQAGLSWAPNRDTLLKIILKAKDEEYLLDAWISHHKSIVGLENIIILDCGSTDAAYLAALEKYRNDVLILNYEHYYDAIHDTKFNRDFFDLIGRNCRFVSVLDADEFLVGMRDNLLSAELVKPVLKRTDSKILCGAWLNIELDKNNISDAAFYDLSAGSIISGAIAGKAVVRSDMVIPPQTNRV